MNIACFAATAAHEPIAATIRAYGSVRARVVDDGLQPPLDARLLQRLGDESGLAALRNTLFNERDEPIVCTPAEALRTFCASVLDALRMGGF